ncbi:hypothetical protein IQ06DRAFT_26583 [Phaeosphaeriaceae sp. SRC1lsM3a]|nr:hypothetical protein IQ06DRAFT_26583 [Stagonospora sp. SRC1lsM3a]
MRVAGYLSRHHGVVGLNQDDETKSCILVVLKQSLSHYLGILCSYLLIVQSLSTLSSLFVASFQTSPSFVQTSWIPRCRTWSLAPPRSRAMSRSMCRTALGCSSRCSNDAVHPASLLPLCLLLGAHILVALILVVGPLVVLGVARWRRRAGVASIVILL